MTDHPSLYQGSEKITRYGAYGIIYENDKLLLTQKRSGPYKELWDLPGGGIEFGEAPESTLKRELEEEAALAFDQWELITVMTHCCRYFSNGKEIAIHHIGIIYRIEGLTLLPSVVPEETLLWLSLDRIIPERLTPFAKQSYSTMFQKHK